MHFILEIRCWNWRTISSILQHSRVINVHSCRAGHQLFQISVTLSVSKTLSKLCLSHDAQDPRSGPTE